MNKPKLKIKDIAIVILTYNSEKIIKKTIQKAKEISKNIIIVDSFSNDKTLKIAKKLNCKIIRRKFLNYADQRNYIIKKCDRNFLWQLHIDADEILSSKLVKNIKEIIKVNNQNYSFIIKRKVYFLGKLLKFGGASNWHLRLFPSKSTIVENKLYDQHFISLLKAKPVKGCIYDRNIDDLNSWINKHNRWSNLDIINNPKSKQKVLEGNIFGNNIERLRLYKNIYLLFPTIIRPFILFFYKYFILLGFLDGKVGFYYCFLNSLWFRTLIDAKNYEKKNKK